MAGGGVSEEEGFSAGGGGVGEGEGEGALEGGVGEGGEVEVELGWVEAGDAAGDGGDRP